MKRPISTYAKALVAGLVAAVSAAIPLADDGFTFKEVLLIVLAFLVAEQGVFWTPNKDKTGQFADESVQPSTPTALPPA